MSALLAALAVGAVTQVGGVRGPEDLEVLPGGHALLVSEFGGLQGAPGRLVRLDLATRRVTPLYPPAEAAASSMPSSTSLPPAAPTPAASESWGDAACHAEPGARFSPHGIHLSHRTDGALQLLVVNHGGRESIEFFEVRDADANARLVWRGCVAADADAFLNDVASLPDGGFVATMMYRRSDSEGLARAFRGENTGYVLRWSHRTGWSRVPGTEGPMPNGIQTTPDGRLMFVAMWGASRVVKFAFPTSMPLGSVKTLHPDNLSWAPDGQLLAVGPETMPSYTECRTGREEGCFAPAHVDAIDTHTMRARTIFRYEHREMLPASVAVQSAHALYVGSYDGDRLLEVQIAADDERTTR